NIPSTCVVIVDGIKFLSILDKKCLRIYETFPDTKLILTIANVQDYHLTRNFVIMEIRSQDLVKPTYLIWDYDNKLLYQPKFNILVQKITKILFVGNILYIDAYANGSYCMFSTFDKKHFNAMICELFYQPSLSRCVTRVHPLIPGIVFANIVNKHSILQTMISLNGGINWNPIRVDFDFPHCRRKMCNLSLNLCDEKVSQIDWVDIRIGRLRQYRVGYIETYFVTFDAGISWRPVPNSTLSAFTLDQGRTIVALDEESNNILYSLDEGSKWTQTQILDDSAQLHSVVAFNVQKKNFVSLVVRYPKRHTLSFVTIENFMNRCIFHKCYASLDPDCQQTDHETFIVSRLTKDCFQGKRYSYDRIKKATRCRCTEDYTETIISDCPCLQADFMWYPKNHKFGHKRLKFGVCEVDSDFEKNKSYTCTEHNGQGVEEYI
ncbi:hypothetical protein MXB_569, partial [Myxobolus squamalis]